MAGHWSQVVQRVVAGAAVEVIVEAAAEVGTLALQLAWAPLEQRSAELASRVLMNRPSLDVA